MGALARIRRLLADFSEWYWYSPQVIRHPRPGIHVVWRRQSLDRLERDVNHACNAYRNAGFNRPGHSFSPEDHKELTDKYSYIGRLLRGIQAELRELTRYEANRAALKFPRVPTYDELVKLRRHVKRMRKED